MNSSTPLSWSLVVATYQRQAILPICLQLAATQTRKPAEIIVIDASRDWKETRDRVMAQRPRQGDSIRWIYQTAVARSLTLQRNEGIQLATSDIVFLIDDDSLMYPNCAEAIMRVYEADANATVKGVQANTVHAPPGEIIIEDRRKPAGRWPEPKGLTKSFQRWILRNVFLMGATKIFIPYDGQFYTREMPASVAELNVVQIPLLEGYGMTYRRQAILQEPFEPLLRFYAAGEDLDASYRVSRQGCLLMAIDSKLHHFTSAGGRLSRLKVSALSAMNQALFIRKNSNNFQSCRRQFYVLLLRRIIAEFLKDLLSCRLSLPQMRGLFVALKPSHKIFTLPLRELAEWYPRFQQDFLGFEG